MPTPRLRLLPHRRGERLRRPGGARPRSPAPARTWSTWASASRTSPPRRTWSRPRCKALRDGHHGYTPATGILPLREAIAADLERRTGAGVDPERVMVVPGGKVTIVHAILMFGEPGAEILYPDPGFPIYPLDDRVHRGDAWCRSRSARRNGFAFSAAETLALISRPKTRLVILNSPANPTGGVTPRAEIEALVAGLAAHPDVAILSDEIYGTMTYDGEEHVSLLTFPRDPRPPDPSRRGLEDLRDDGLAARLVGLAGRALRGGAQASAPR